MNKKIIMAVFLILLFQLPQVANAGLPYAKSWFGGWVGHKQKNRVVNASTWFACWSNKRGACITGTLTTGKSRCTTWSFDVGADWDFKRVIKGLGLSVSGGRSWSACNLRSESFSCQPNPGYKGRAALVVTVRYGKQWFKGSKPFWVRTKNWNKAVHGCNRAGWWRKHLFSKKDKTWRFGALSLKAKYHYAYCDTTTDAVKGYLPEKRWAFCQYRRG